MARMLLGTALLGALLLAAPTAGATAAGGCRPPLRPADEIDLFLGRAKPSGAIVGERAMARFLDEVVSPRFPDGLTVLDAYGEFRTATGALFREPAKLVVLLVPDAAAVEGKIQAIIKAYKRRFSQNAVLRTEQRLCLDLG
ncbi:MAG: DUF3574 domain-containing protein [Geminicoccaceae bacterium]